MGRNSLKIYLNTSLYKSPTQEDINAAKNYILRRNDYATLLGNKVDECLLDAAQQIVTICYKYDVEPQKFFIGSDYNEKMMDEISQVMDEAEEEILSFIYDYSTESIQEPANVLDGSPSRKKELLAAWIATLGRGNRNFQDTLDGYLYKTMKDWEATIAALRFAGVALTDAITKVKSNFHSIFTMPEVVEAFRHAEDFNATYIRSRGVMQGGVGLSNNGSTNVTNMARITLQMAWMREQGIEFDESGAAGYYVLRGSSYPCALCDDACGFHPLTDLSFFPPLHPHCCCYVIPIYKKEGRNNENDSQFAERRKEIRELAKQLTEEVFTNERFDKEIHLSNRGIKEWLNQPHKHYAEKNELLLSIKKVIRNSQYIGWLPDEHNASIKAHLFETTVGGEKSWIIVREFQDGKVLLHSITDSDEIIRALERYKNKSV